MFSYKINNEQKSKVEPRLLVVKHTESHLLEGRVVYSPLVLCKNMEIIS